VTIEEPTIGVYLPECDPEKTLVERLRIAADRGWRVRVADWTALATEAAQELERGGR
jgi:hypothetical protein